MAKRIKKSERLPEDRPAALGELIHAQVRVAIETAVHEELAIALGAGRYERHAARRGQVGQPAVVEERTWGATS